MAALPEPVAAEVEPAARPNGASGREGALAWLDEDVTGKGVRQRRFDVVRDDRRIPGLVWTPSEGDGPRPLVLLGHGGSCATTASLRPLSTVRCTVTAVPGRPHPHRSSSPNSRSCGPTTERG